MQAQTATTGGFDQTADKRHPLDAFFVPRTVAVIGATDTAGSVGRTVLWNLISQPGDRTIFPVNPKRSSVLGIKAYPDIGAVPDPVDLAVIVTPAPTVPGVIGACADAGVRAAIVISAGFKEIGEQGVELERQILEQARRGRMRIIGPNCLGLMNPRTGLNATFAGAMAHSGKVAFISQSGALCTAVLDWSLSEQVGFSAFISIGAMLDVSWGDLIDYLGDDPHTQSIVLYMESIGNARAFLSAAREVALTKPIIVIKGGRTEAAARAAASHTGSLAGSDEVLEAAFLRCGVLRVDTVAEMFEMAEVLAKQPRPRGPRLTILTNAGGPGVLATDELIGSGGRLAELPPDTINELNQILPAHWSHGNPIDIIGDADPERYAKAADVAARNPQSDGLLVILTPQAMTDPTRTAERLIQDVQISRKPFIASWMGGAHVAAGEAILNRAGVPTFAYPDSAVRAFNDMCRYSENLRSLYETPTLAEDNIPPDRALADGIIAAARANGRTLLTELESKQILAAYGIPTTETRLATSADAAVEQAEALGYPVVLKLHSETLTHKTDVGGVQLNLADADAVRTAFERIVQSVGAKAGAEHMGGVTVQPMIRSSGYELIVGSSVDPQLGPVLLFGTGGQLVEVYRDRALALPPLNTTLARRMMERTRVFTALRGVRGLAPVSLEALEQLMVRFSRLVVEQRLIREIDINPLLASAERLLALDARVVLHDPVLSEADVPPLAIRPYPSHLVQPWNLINGTPVTIRPIRPEDEPLLVAFHHTLSPESVYYRYFHPLNLAQRISHERLTRMCFIDYDREMALVIERRDAHGQPEIIAVGRLTRTRGRDEAEFALLVSDNYQRQGMGRELLRRLVAFGHEEQVKRIVGFILPDNYGMLNVAEQLGFRLRRSAGQVEAILDMEE